MATDDPGPKSYSRALPLDAKGDLVIFQGPIMVSPSLSIRHLFLDVDDANLHAAVPPSPERVDRWVRADIHVPSRPDWIFIKAFAHGAQSDGDIDAVLGPAMDETLTYLEHHYNDGSRYILHYVTAREAYNLVRAAVAGAAGEPAKLMNFGVPPYVADARMCR
jgi:hypothetical protein